LAGRRLTIPSNPTKEVLTWKITSIVYTKWEGVNSQIKVFNQVSRWRKGITLLAYLYGYAIGYSFFRKSQI
jgi:hypothetical protein